MAKLYNRVGHACATAGTGTLTLGSALGVVSPNSSSYQSAATAGIQDQDTIPYLILDSNNAWEYGTGTYTSAGTTLTRTLGKSSTGSLLVLSGNEQVFIVERAEDLGIWTNTRLAKSANYPVSNADKGSTIALGGSAYFTLTLNAPSGYDSNFMIKVVNEDTIRAKLIAANGLSSFYLWPGQTCEIFNQNNVWICPRQRWVLPASQNIYVDTTNGHNDTTVDGMTSGSAYLGYDYAYSQVRDFWDLGGNTTVTCNVVQTTATVTAGYTLFGKLTGIFFEGSPFGCPFIIKGAGIGTTTIQSSTNSVQLFFAAAGGSFLIQDMKLSSSGAGGSCILVSNGIVMYQNINFGVSGNSHCDCAGPTSLIEALGPWTVSGSCNISMIAEDEAFIIGGQTLTVSGTPAWTTAYCQADLKGFQDYTGFTFTGAGATGKRCQVLSQGTIFSGGGGSLNTFFPGSVNGTADAPSFAYFV